MNLLKMKTGEDCFPLTDLQENNLRLKKLAYEMMMVKVVLIMILALLFIGVVFVAVKIPVLSYGFNKWISSIGC